ncbi:MAG: hypothetical protein HFJ91_03875 [Muribaculaceae bacterium]|nr:hypothetical protein [Muribaculaceae bacterium]
MAKTNSRKQQKEKKPSFITRFVRGTVLSSDFFARHWLPTLIFIVVMMVYITTKYTCKTNMERIAALEKKLEIVENERSRERSAFMSRIRETSMQQMVDSLHLNLRVQPQPPYKIPRD